MGVSIRLIIVVGIINIRCAGSARQCPHKRSQVGAKVGSREHQIRHLEVGKLGQNVVEGDKRASCGRSVVVPNVAILWVTADLKECNKSLG